MPLFTGSDAVSLSVIYAEGLTETEARTAEMQGGVDLSSAGLAAVANHAATIALAKVAGMQPDGTPFGDSADLEAPTLDGKPIDPILNVLAIIAEQVGRVADNTGGVETHIPVEIVMEKWERMGMRMNEDLAVAFVETLPGVIVDK